MKLLSFDGLSEQACGRAAVGASRELVMAFGHDSPVVLGLAARRGTRFVRFAHCARPTATSQMLKRAARAAASPALVVPAHKRFALMTLHRNFVVGSSQAPRRLPTRSLARHRVVRHGLKDIGMQPLVLHGRGARPGGGAWVASSSAGARGLPAAQRRVGEDCLSSVLLAKASKKGRVPQPPSRTEQRREVRATARTAEVKPPPGSAPRPCRSVSRKKNTAAN